MTSIREVSRCDVVFKVNSSGDTLEIFCTTARYDRVLATSKDLIDQVEAILVLRRESVSCHERAVVPFIANQAGSQELQASFLALPGVQAVLAG